MDHTYWRRQQPGKPLFPDIEWAKPERRDQAGTLLIIGGNKLGFVAVAEAYQTALSAGVGEAKVVLPNCLKKSIPPTLLDVVFANCTISGGLAKDSLPELRAASDWAGGVLLIGDAGRNAETTVVYEDFIATYSGQITVTRDAVDLVRNSPSILVERHKTLLVVSFAQLQKLFGGVYYPKILTFSMQLMQLVEALHKFTITYPCTIVTLHQETLLIANGGHVITQPWHDPMALWRGSVATNAATHLLWHPESELQSIVTSVV